jgi:RNA recognition motif-containing protein
LQTSFGETKDAGFKRPAKLQRKEGSEEVPVKRRKTEPELAGVEKPPSRPYGHAEEAEGDYYPTTVFVGNLDESVPEQEIDKIFSQFGTIENIRLIAGKHFGFVKYSTREAAQSCIAAMNGELLGATRLRVSRAKTPAARNSWRRRTSWDPYHPRDEGNPAPATPFYPSTPFAETDSADQTNAEREGAEPEGIQRDRHVLQYNDL